MLTRTRLHRGFTLVEVMTGMVILLILSALAVTWWVYGPGRARMNNAVFDVAALLHSAQLRAVSRGTPHFIVLHQTPDHRVRLQLLERPDAPPVISWAALDLTQGPEVALAFERTLPDGTVELAHAIARDRLELGVGTGLDSRGLAFLDLDSSRIPRPLPAPFNTLPLTTQAHPTDPDKPTRDLMAGCSFCVSPAGHPYGVLRLNADGTMTVMTGNAETGAVIAFAPDTADEKDFAPKLLTISAPAGATVVF